MSVLFIVILDILTSTLNNVQSKSIFLSSSRTNKDFTILMPIIPLYLKSTVNQYFKF